MEQIREIQQQVQVQLQDISENSQKYFEKFQGQAQQTFHEQIEPKISTLQLQIGENLDKLSGVTRDFLATNDFTKEHLTSEQIIKLSEPNVLIGATLAVIGLSTFFIYFTFKRGSPKSVGKDDEPLKKKTKGKKKSKKGKKKASVVEEFNATIDQVVEFVDSEISPKVKEYESDLVALKEGKSKKSKKDVNYLFVYIEEALLKELLKLDGLKHNGNTELRSLRKKTIEKIQLLHKKIDSLKKEYAEYL